MVVLVGIAAAAMATGCGADPYDGFDGMPPPTSAVTGEPERATVTVQARDNSFLEREVTIAAGTEVVWTNVGRNVHDVIPSDFEDEPAGAPWGIIGDRFGSGATYSHVFGTPGVYAYLCTIHGVRDKGMAGTVTVTE